MIQVRAVLNKVIRCVHNDDSNCPPQSVVIVDGTPKHVIQPETSVCATVAAEMFLRGKASGHRVNQSTHDVKRYVYP